MSNRQQDIHIQSKKTNVISVFPNRRCTTPSPPARPELPLGLHQPALDLRAEAGVGPGLLAVEQLRQAALDGLVDVKQPALVLAKQAHLVAVGHRLERSRRHDVVDRRGGAAHRRRARAAAVVASAVVRRRR